MQAIRSIGEFLREHTRAEDMVCRYGGEEFLIVMLEATMDVALSCAQQIREGIKVRLDWPALRKDGWMLRHVSNRPMPPCTAPREKAVIA